jgi:GNAT superfamily N-acetyltransferase
MLHGYFNYSTHLAENRWDRRAFVRNWWRIYGGDKRWTPPRFPSLQRALVRGSCEFLARQLPQLIHLEALPDTRRLDRKGMARPTGPLWETPVCAAALLMDPRRRDRTAYLSLLRCTNDAESLERFVGIALEQAAQAGYRRLVGPTGLSPHLQSGVLLDHFDITPPLHTPYNPPYMPEVTQAALSPLQSSRLYHVATDSEPSHAGGAANRGIEIVRLDESDWQRTLVPLFTQVFDDPGEFPPPDAEEAVFLLEWVSVWPLSVWVAFRDGEPVGFVMLQPDLAGPVTRARGGRNPLWRLWLTLRSRRPVASGRLLFGGVAPGHRGKGIGGRLWRHALGEARAAGWESVTVGPLPQSHPAATFLESRGAEARQSYKLYASEF